MIPTFRRPAQVVACLAALADQTIDPELFEVIVVDDSSGDDTPELVSAMAETAPFTLRLIRRTGGNRGPALARNLGWNAAGSDVIAFLDDDCVPGPPWLEAGLVPFSRDDAVGVVQGRTKAPDGVDLWGLTDWYTWQTIDAPTAHFEACNIFYRRQALAETRGFDERIPWPWGEDTELGWKVLDAGWERAFATEAVVTHPVERRGMRWYVRTGLRDSTLVGVAAAYPPFRQAAFWRPWAHRREDPALVAAIAGALVGLRWRPALLAALPYLWWRRPSIRQPHFFRLALQTPIVDAARVAGQLRGSVRYRILTI
ncbi:MAG: glycosyltransferase family 2 protein [Acidimicrobiales bacterium]